MMERTESIVEERTDPSPEVLEKPVRRRFTVEYKGRILAKVETEVETGTQLVIDWVAGFCYGWFMPRRARITPGGLVYHVLKIGVGAASGHDAKATSHCGLC